MTSRRRGFTLAEIVVALVIAGIIGASFTRLLVNQNRYFDHETNLRTARSIARSATNIMLADLRMVQDSGGVDSVTADGKLMRIVVPYRFGLVCATNGGVTIMSMLPTDSATVALSVYRGFAYRDSLSGRYRYIWPANPTTSDRPTTSTSWPTCTGSAPGQARIQTVSTNGRQGQVMEASTQSPSGATPNQPVFFFQRITYSFRASGIYPNRLALWRNVENGRNEELMAPFDTSARFMFYADGDDASRLAPPPVSDIRGVDLVLSALSPRGTSADSSRLQSRVVTSVFFKNVRRF